MYNYEFIYKAGLCLLVLLIAQLDNTCNVAIAMCLYISQADAY